METTIKVNAPAGYVPVFDEKNHTLNFAEKPKNVMERVKSFEDVLSELGLTQNIAFPNESFFESDEIAYRQAKFIAKALNEGWTPDWGNDEYKYYLWFNMGGSSGSLFSVRDCVSGRSGSSVGSRLCFKSAELARYAGKQFENLFRDYFVIAK